MPSVALIGCSLDDWRPRAWQALLRAGMATIDGVALDVTPTKEKAPGNSPAPSGRKRKPRA